MKLCEAASAIILIAVIVASALFGMDKSDERRERKHCADYGDLRGVSTEFRKGEGCYELRGEKWAKVFEH